LHEAGVVVGAQFDASSVGRDEGGQGGLLDPGSRSQPNHPALAWCPRDWPACRTGYGYRPDRWRTGRGWSWPRRWRRQPPDAARPRPSAAASRRTPGTPAVVAAPARSMLSLTANGAGRGECARVLSIIRVIEGKRRRAEDASRPSNAMMVPETGVFPRALGLCPAAHITSVQGPCLPWTTAALRWPGRWRVRGRPWPRFPAVTSRALGRCRRRTAAP